jgi:nucleoside 2-deoxyribosyltransferase
VHDSGQRQHFSTGSVRDFRKGKGRYDLMPAAAMHRLARHYENGAAKYGDRNWEKGQPVGRFLDSALRHIFGFLGGKREEDHLAAAAWNCLGAIETLERIAAGLLPATLDDLPPALTRPPETRLVPLLPAWYEGESVYLAGPITGQEVDWLWRTRAAELLRPLHTLNPLRGKRPSEVSALGLNLCGEPVPVSCGERDRADLDSASVVLAHFPYLPERQAVGTLWECGYAHAKGMPVVVACAIPEIAGHLFVRSFADSVHADLDAACARVRQILENI